MNKKRAWVRSLVFFTFFAFLGAVCSLHGQMNSCVECHGQLEEELKAPVIAFSQDIHNKFGLSCKDCHGGNPSQAEKDSSKDQTFKGSPKRTDIPRFCGSCHSSSSYMRTFNPSMRVDQEELYWTSNHGQLLRKGDTKVAVCTDCHGAHEIQASTHPKSLTFPWNIPQMCGRCHASEDYMVNYKIATNQLDEYKESVHARALFEKKDLSAPTCNDCHGNHGATPPEVASISFVCRQCHTSTSELFSRSPHKRAFDDMGFSECEACHGNHKVLPPSDAMLGTGKDSVCIQCHEPESKGYEVALRMKDRLDSFLAKFEEARTLIERAEKQGVEVSEPKFKLQDGTTTIILVRNLTHSLSLEEIEKNVQEGEKVISQVQKAGLKALEEAKFRKTGLLISTFFIVLVAIALYIKIKEISRKSHA